METTKRRKGRPNKAFFDYRTTKEEIEFCQNYPHKTCEKGVCDELKAFKRGKQK